MNNTDLYIALSLLIVALYLYCVCEDNVVEGLLVGTIDDIKNKELQEFDKIEQMELFFEKYQGIHDPLTPNEFVDDLKKWNPTINSSNLKVGQIIKIYKK